MGELLDPGESLVTHASKAGHGAAWVEKHPDDGTVPKNLKSSDSPKEDMQTQRRSFNRRNASTPNTDVHREDKPQHCGLNSSGQRYNSKTKTPLKGCLRKQHKPVKKIPCKISGKKVAVLCRDTADGARPAILAQGARGSVRLSKRERPSTAAVPAPAPDPYEDAFSPPDKFKPACKKSKVSVKPPYLRSHVRM